ncbi:hypothetical protein RFI_34160 [Reticulomyxa filosa]|uniref:Uncharacterized protein n=1 Tax=Reticulomyxa filosa TaxID=46433 RepID=X6LNP5_RETFI|nr:hypothetical protein RFI_34160 [Reticulomyxa filosa]|eukprot:ETO03244.1 hypothetical protein RFI_34160 [Reticulomyxa filosa]
MALNNQATVFVTLRPDFNRIRRPGMMVRLIEGRQVLESQVSEFPKRPRVVFISMLHLYWNYQTIPIDVLCTSLCIFRCSEKWLFTTSTGHNTMNRMSIHARANNSKLETWLEKMRQDQDFVEFLLYKNKLQFWERQKKKKQSYVYFFCIEILWLEPNVSSEHDDDDEEEEEEEEEEVSKGQSARTGCNCSSENVSVSCTQTVSHHAYDTAKEKEQPVTPLIKAYDASSSIANGSATTTTRSVTQDTMLTPMDSGDDVSFNEFEMRFAAASLAHATTPWLVSGAKSNNDSGLIVPIQHPQRDIRERTFQQHCHHRESGQDVATGTSLQPELNAFDNAMKALSFLLFEKKKKKKKT